MLTNIYAMIITRTSFLVNEENKVQRNFPKDTHNQRRKAPHIWTIIRLFAYVWGYCSPHGQQPLSLHFCPHNWLYDCSSPNGIHHRGWAKPQCGKLLKKGIRSKVSTIDILLSDHGLWRPKVVMVLKYPRLSHCLYIKIYKA